MLVALVANPMPNTIELSTPRNCASISSNSSWSLVFPFNCIRHHIITLINRKMMMIRLITELLSRRASSDRVESNRLHGIFGAFARILGKAQVVIGAHIERLDLAPGLSERPVVVVRNALEYRDDRSWYRAHWTVETVAQADVEIAHVKRLIFRV